ncbi:hypothetical protein FXN61_19370 [Lentzea sp. PSKA42]|uniref:Uncharacterized protein n=1 Tax=Lentzea indica TaxID=2604800 RepID=A0ABX1FJC7_9PSEU|nr:hypothetical protein [Lentzea indica]NKE58849.1 hypothetical protein [Lentzea indica]
MTGLLPAQELEPCWLPLAPPVHPMHQLDPAQNGVATMAVNALIFTGSFVLFMLLLAGICLHWFFVTMHGQHADADEGALTVAMLESQLDDEVRELVESPVLFAPRHGLLFEPSQQIEQPVWTPPELVAA